MTLKNIAQNIDVVVNSDISHGFSGKAAIIDCQNTDNLNLQHWGGNGYDTSSCTNPKFKVNLDVKLPFINKKATDVKEMLIGEDSDPDNNCKTFFPGPWVIYDVEFHGQPSGVVCGITSSVNFHGKPISADANDNGGLPPVAYSDGDQTTTGQDNVGYVAPPAGRVFFKTISVNDGFACIGNDKGQACLPNGEYSEQKGIIGIESSTVNSLELPKNSKIAVDTGYIEAVFEGALQKGTHHWDKDININGAPKNEKFVDDMKDLYANHFSVVDGPAEKAYPIKAVCLFTETNYGGDALCLGEGHDFLPDKAKNIAQSVKVLGDTGVWLYQNTYGDKNTIFLTTDCNDLGSGECIGKTKNSFKKKVYAMWVKDSDPASGPGT